MTSSTHPALDELRRRFIKIYGDIPLELRSEIILVLAEEPISWNVAYQQIEAKNEKGMKILELLEKLKFI